MKRALRLMMSLAVMAGFMLPTLGLATTGTALAAPAKDVSPHTYQVLVGWEDMRHGVEVNAFFPSKLRIHVGDSVLWKANTMEIHTVTFLAGKTLPDLLVTAPPNPINSPLMVNPLAAFPQPPQGGSYDGSTYANSGILSLDPGQATTFSLTFTKAGVYPYVCIVHGMSMSGTITVEDPSVEVSSPSALQVEVQKQIANQSALIPGAIKSAFAHMERPTHNPDGSFTFHVLVGFSYGIVDIHQFFPKKIYVAPGDKVEFKLSKSDMAPHTATFLNGGASPDTFVILPQPNAPPLILVNPKVMFPANAGQPLTDQGYYNSGFMVPGGPNTSFTFPIGQFTGVLPFECLLHDQMGMNGQLVVTPRNIRPHN